MDQCVRCRVKVPSARVQRQMVFCGACGAHLCNSCAEEGCCCGGEMSDPKLVVEPPPPPPPPTPTPAVPEERRVSPRRGRPKVMQEAQRLVVLVSYDIMVYIDQERGEQSRAAYIRGLFRARMMRHEDPVL